MAIQSGGGTGGHGEHGKAWLYFIIEYTILWDFPFLEGMLEPETVQSEMDVARELYPGAAI